MDKRQTRLFAIGATAVSAQDFIGPTIDSHRQFPKLTQSQNLTPQALRGKDGWHENNCINCHTLFGKGGHYAPDLTKIAQHRGEAYLQADMQDPSQLCDETRHRRLMPKYDHSESDITALIAFLDWTSKVDHPGWPPHPIIVSGASLRGTDRPLATTPAGARPVKPGGSPIAPGERVFRSAQPACTWCHSIAAGVNMADPSLAGVATRASAMLQEAGYTGQAEYAAGSPREAVPQPCAHIEVGGMYASTACRSCR